MILINYSTKDAHNFITYKQQIYYWNYGKHAILLKLLLIVKELNITNEHSDLNVIIIDKKANDDKFYCDKIFRYCKKYINIEFESTGIRKLVRLYSALKACTNGGIVFIDEMDANLHDVYFTRFIEFFKNDSKGQLCFTTHNLEQINVLKDNGH